MDGDYNPKIGSDALSQSIQRYSLPAASFILYNSAPSDTYVGTLFVHRIGTQNWVARDGNGVFFVGV